MKKLLTLLLTLFVALTLVACTTEKETPKPTDPTATDENKQRTISRAKA